MVELKKTNKSADRKIALRIGRHIGFEACVTWRLKIQEPNKAFIGCSDVLAVNQEREDSTRRECISFVKNKSACKCLGINGKRLRVSLFLVIFTSFAALIWWRH